MQLLVLGATGLSGTAITRAALERGHHVVAVHRGNSRTLDDLTGADRLVQVVHDRVEGHAELLSFAPFDAIVDVSARIPAWVADAVRTLDEDSPWWVQLSSVSVIADLSRPRPDETVDVARFDDPVLELSACTDPRVEFSYEWYAPAKAACERLLLEGVARQPRSTVLRPVLITGAYDWTWRAPYWVERIARGGTAAAPPAGDPVQVVDSRDLAEAALAAIERRVPGVYNIAPPPGAQTVGSLLGACSEAVRAAGLEPAGVVHVPAALLAEHGIEEWSHLPAWIADPGYVGMVTSDSALAHELLGYRARPFVETAAWLLDWIRAGATNPGSAGLDPDRERAVLEAYSRIGTTAS